MFYTFLKNPAAETLLGHSLELMAREIGKMPECSGVRAVVLGGGYGRGEGGATPEGALPISVSRSMMDSRFGRSSSYSEDSLISISSSSLMTAFPQIHSNPLSGTSAGSGKRSFP